MSTRTSKATQERLPAAHRHFNLFFFFPSLSVNTSKEELVHILATAYAPGAAAAACSGVLVVIMCCGMPSLAPRGLQHIWGCLPFLCHGLGPAQCSDQRQMPPPPSGAPRRRFACTGRCIPSGTLHPGAAFPLCRHQQSWSRLHSTRTSGKLT